MRISAIIGAFVLFASSLLAQGTTSRVLGVVTDATGAAVPGASMRLIREGANTAFTTKTSDIGAYLFEAVQTATSGNFGNLFTDRTLSKSLDTRSYDPIFTTVSAANNQSASSTPWDTPANCSGCDRSLGQVHEENDQLPSRAALVQHRRGAAQEHQGGRAPLVPASRRLHQT